MNGLCYTINTQDNNPDPASKLSPQQKFDQFIKFVRDGKQLSPGVFEKTADGREKTGVLAWLLSIPVSEANFFATQPVDTGTMLVVTLPSPTEPWIEIQGFMDFVKAGPPPNLADADGQIKLAEISDLSAELRRRAQLNNVVPPASLKLFRDALAGKKDSPGLGAAVDALGDPIRGRVRDLLGLK
jgi:hypothetical protein